MRRKKILKVIGYIILIPVLVIAAMAGYIYYQYQGKYPVDKNKHPFNIGHVNLEKALFTEGFEMCDDKHLLGYYHSSAPRIYRENKLAFVQKIRGSYKNKNYQDTGYLNLRFHINCEGKVGNVEVNELDTDMRISNLTDSLVNQLVELSIKEDNWQVEKEKYETTHNHYMYLLFKIENGNIAEILP
ncbi:hypothetical protein [Aquimarina sp. 2304DJ70-9]|uniref:hypothetical protein n=1 Tax=Aquimarina penaris TaxID=3231044 RepID=UPI003462077C